MEIRLLVLLGLALAVVVVTVAYRRRRSADELLGASDPAGQAWPALPSDERQPDRAATWVIFTTPLCASCGAVEADLQRAFPHHGVRRIDATEQPALAERYSVKRAPTTLLAGADGSILQRLVGPEAVRAFIGTAEDPAPSPR